MSANVKRPYLHGAEPWVDHLVVWIRERSKYVTLGLGGQVALGQLIQWSSAERSRATSSSNTQGGAVRLRFREAMAIVAAQVLEIFPFSSPIMLAVGCNLLRHPMRG